MVIKEPIQWEQGWGLMQEAITKLKNILEGLTDEKSFTSEEYMNQYTTIYDMCTQKLPCEFNKELYDKYKEIFDEYLNSSVWPSLRDKHHEFLLRELLRRWNSHKVMTRWLSRFFRYLECYYIERRTLPSLNTVALSCFRDLTFDKVKAMATDAIISLIHKEREGEQIDPSLLKNVVHIYVEIGVYEQDFEVAMIADASTYYARKATNWIEVDSFADYMLKAEESLKRERYRVREAGYLHSSTENKLVETVQHELLVTHATRLLENDNSGCGVLLRDDKVEDLSRIYRLYHEIPKGLELVANTFKKHVTSEGARLIQQVEEASNSQTINSSSGVQEHSIVSKFIELHDRFMAYVKGCFMNNNIFHKALKEAFEVFCNKNVAGIPSVELVAAFCDNMLKKGGGSEKLSDEAIDETQEKVVYLLVYNTDKDLFAEFYRKKLARRLLSDRSANEDHEKSFLCKLKRQFGGHYTSKMEGMMTDLVIAKDCQRSYEQYLHINQHVNPGIDLSVTVLTTGTWPSYKSCSLNLPSEMVKCVEAFNEYYTSKAKHKKLSWAFSMGACNIHGKFQKKTIELIVSTYQAATLLLFNNADKLSFLEIKTQLGLDYEDLVRVLHSLSCVKYKILCKEPNTKTISQNDIFEFNSGFTDRVRRIKVPLPPIDERKKVVKDVDKDRKYAIDAAIVRIMKSRKTLGHQQLVLECIEMMSCMFKPDVKVIKKRIENLIGQDYLERDPNDANAYRYLA
ncbi:hypothetical protein QN277_025777 [Acacia crassicarpa]|uniref:Cullin family profile domain-containing protein n=1 Tax=Acacia crassicarpa TaxID=499986 RepID=A0AAE1MGN7_9FABA|nr:hypothetical protein QN277_025777 [Acacia crassicarpa]